MHRTSVSGSIDPDALATRQEFAAALTAVRESAGLTVREVARAAGVSASTVGGYFSGRHLPPVRPEGGIRAILSACGVVEPAELEAWQRALVRIRRAPGPRPGALPAPYRGLAAYRPQDEAIFHGRDAEIRLLCRRLSGAGVGSASGLVVLLGRAGSGKSSLVQAGLLPRLRAADRRVAVLAPGPHPVRALAHALALLGDVPADAAAGAVRSGPAAVRALLPDPAGRDDRVIVLPGASGEPGEADRRPVLVVDQVEELLTGGADRHEQETFVTALAALARPGSRGAAPVAVLIVLRSEAVTGAARFPDLACAVGSALEDGPGGPAGAVVLRPMDAEALRSVTLGPARRAGLDVDPDLVTAVLADAADLAGRGGEVLPQVSQALLATWRRGRRGRLTLAAYRDVGGVAGAVESAAEAVWLALPEATRTALPEVLTEVLTGVRGDRTEVDAAGQDPTAALRALVEAGLLDPGPSAAAPTGTTADAERPLRLPAGLEQGWPRLRQWLEAASPDGASPPRAPLAPTGPVTPSAAGDERQGTRSPDPDPESNPDSGVPWWHRVWLQAALVVALLVTTGTAVHLAR